MTKSQKIQVELSELRQKINGALSKEELTDAERADLEGWTSRAQDLEPELRAAIVAEGGELEQRQADAINGANGDGELAEHRALLSRASVGRYLELAANGQPLDGAEAELNEALEIRSGATGIPWLLLAAELEQRNDAASTTAALGGPERQRPILQRLFGRDILGALGVRVDSVPAGVSEWPILTGGATPAQTAEDADQADAVAPSFTTQSLKPKRLTGRYVFTVEQAAQVGGLESALRMDLADSVRAQMSKQALTGTGTGANVAGLLSRITQPDAPADEADFGDYAGAAAKAVDGLHAASEGEVSVVMGTATYQHAAALTHDGSGECATEVMRRRAASAMASSYIPAPPTSGARQNVQGAILHAGTDQMRGDSIAAVWPALEVVRDPYSSAGEGRVILTTITLWDCYTAFRAGAYKRLAFKLA